MMPSRCTAPFSSTYPRGKRNAYCVLNAIGLSCVMTDHTARNAMRSTRFPEQTASYQDVTPIRAGRGGISGIGLVERELDALDVELDVEPGDAGLVGLECLLRELLEAAVDEIDPADLLLHVGAEQRDRALHLVAGEVVAVDEPLLRRRSPRLVVRHRDRALDVGRRHLGRVVGRLAGDADLVRRALALPREGVDRRDALARQAAHLEPEVRGKPCLLLGAVLAADRLSRR